MLYRARKALYFSAYPLALIVLVLFACSIRLFFISQHWPGTNSDESIIDLMALHIAYQGKFPLFYYGQGYMGSLEAYLGAVFYYLSGVSIMSVRLGMVLLFAGFLISMYFLLKTLYTRTFALFMLLIFSLGSPLVIRSQLLAIGGYAETRLFATLLFLIATLLALRASSSSAETEKRQRIHALLYGLFGLVIALGLWSNPVILSCIIPAFVFLCIFCRKDIRKYLFYLIAGFIIGISPFIIHNLQVPFDQGTLSTLFKASSLGASRGGVTLWQHLAQIALISLPTATGYYATCAVHEPAHGVDRIIDIFSSNADFYRCVLLPGSWTLMLAFLWGIACYACVSPLLKNWRNKQSAQNDQRQITIIAARFMLLMGATFALGQYMLSAAPSTHPGTSYRYLVCVFLGLPAIFWPLWSGLKRLRQFSLKMISVRLICFALLMLVLVVFAQGTGIIWRNELSGAQKTYSNQDAFVQYLLDKKVTRFYSDYWTCERLIFHSRERLICSALDEKLRPMLERYPPYRAAVEAAPAVAYVFRANSNAAQAFEKRMDAELYERHIFAEYVIYVPE